jgi:uncharacterized membrane protein (Fun14 family)
MPVKNAPANANNINTAASEINPSWFDKIKLNLQSLSQKYDINIYKIMEIVAYFAAGFFVGFFFKRYTKAAFFAFIVLIISLFLLENFQIIHIDWIKVRDLTGISPQESIGSLVNSFYEWIKTNLIIVISAMVGLILGYKVG